MSQADISRPTDITGGPSLPEGVTLLEAGPHGFVVLSVRWDATRQAMQADPRALADPIAAGAATAVAFSLEGLAVPSDAEASAIRRFVDALQLRGVSVVLHDVSGGFVTAASMDGDLARFARETGLTAAVGVLRGYHETRRRLTSRVGRRLNQLRMPAHALSVPALCAFARDRLESGGLSSELVVDVLQEGYAAMMSALDRLGADEGHLSACATVHDGRATLTVLDDSCPPADGDCSAVQSGAVHRIHRFRIDRHNATVIEKDLPNAPAQSR